MFEFSSSAIFFLSAFLIIVNVALYFSIGYHYCKKVKEKEFIAAIVRRLDLQDPEHPIKAIERATEKKQLLETERDRLIKVINTEYERQIKRDAEQGRYDG